MENEVKVGNCPYCGSSDVKKKQTGGFFCRDCGEILSGCAQCGSFDIGKTKTGIMFCRECGARGDELNGKTVEQPKESTKEEPKDEETKTTEAPAPEVTPVVAIPVVDAVTPNAGHSMAKVELEPEEDDDDEKSRPTIEPIICPQCSSNKISSDDIGYFCESCGTRIIIHDDNYNKNTETDDGSQKIIFTYGEIVPRIDKNKFIKSALIELYRKDTPSDIFDSQFEFSEYKEKLVFNNIKCDTHYTCSVGYNRQETYTDYEKRRVKYSKYANRPASNDEIRNHEYVEVEETVPVTKTRTVTDWRPYEGSTDNLEALCGTSLAPNNDIILRNLNFQYKLLQNTLNHGKIGEGLVIDIPLDQRDGFELTDYSLKQLGEQTGSEIRLQIMKKLPGDTSKDLNLQLLNQSWVTNFRLSTIFKMKAMYNGQQFDAVCYPFGGYPDVILRADGLTSEKETDDLLWKRTKLIALLPLVLSLGLIPLAIFIKRLLVTAIGIGVVIAAFVFWRIAAKIIRKNIKNEIVKMKKKGLNKLLRKMNLEEYEPDKADSKQQDETDSADESAGN